MSRPVFRLLGSGPFNGNRKLAPSTNSALFRVATASPITSSHQGDEPVSIWKVYRSGFLSVTWRIASDIPIELLIYLAKLVRHLVGVAVSQVHPLHPLRTSWQNC